MPRFFVINTNYACRLCLFALSHFSGDSLFDHLRPHMTSSRYANSFITPLAREPMASEPTPILIPFPILEIFIFWLAAILSLFLFSTYK
uniref:Uncharacterized protein n=1 Tax=Daphnia magna TaxID=35525 RepID=A0A0P6EB70_9CRUS